MSAGDQSCAHRAGFADRVEPLALALLLGASLQAGFCLASPIPLPDSPWNPLYWLSCNATRCSGTRPDGLKVSLERQSDRTSPEQSVTGILGDVTLTSTSLRAPLTTASFSGPVLTSAPMRNTSGSVFGTPLSMFTTSSGVVTGQFGTQPVLCSNDGWGYPGNPSCF